MSEPFPGRFPTTAWTLLQDAQRLPDGQRLQAQNEFISRYWKPVFYFIRTRRYPLDRAEDLTQDFLLRVMEKDLVAKADRERGRFRNFLLQNLDWFLADQRPGRLNRQDLFEQQAVPVTSLLREEDRTFEPGADETADSIFMQQWARKLVQRALQQAEQRSKDDGQPDWWFPVFAARYGLSESTSPRSQEKLAEEFGQTRDKVRTAEENMERYFVQSLRDEVRDQVGSDAEVDAEVRDLLTLLAPTKTR